MYRMNKQKQTNEMKDGSKIRNMFNKGLAGFLCMAVMLGMICAAVPEAAYADTSDGIYGDFLVTNTADGSPAASGVSYADGVLTVAGNGLTVSMKSGVTSTTERIVYQDFSGREARPTMVLNGINIDCADNPAVLVSIGSANVNIEGDTTLIGTRGMSFTYANGGCNLSVAGTLSLTGTADYALYAVILGFWNSFNAVTMDGATSAYYMMYGTDYVYPTGTLMAGPSKDSLTKISNSEFSSSTEKYIDILPQIDITGIDAPVLGQTFDSTADCATTGVSSLSNVTWSPDDTLAGSNTEYTATVTVNTSNAGLTNLPTVTVNGATATSVAYGSVANTLVVTYKFPATAKLDKDAMISPDTADFDKYVPADISITKDDGTYSLTNIKNGTYLLQAGTDYTVSGNTVTFSKNYLKGLSVGNQTFVFDYDGGTDPALALTVKDTTPDRAVSTGSSVGGTVSVTPATAKVGDKVTVKATPATGYKLSKIYVDGTAITGSTFIMPDKAVTVSASFVKNTYKISATVSSSKAGTVSGAKSVTYGSSLTLTAKAKTGYDFVKWTKNGKKVSTSKQLKLTNVKASAVYKAVFARTEVTISAKASTGGKVSGAKSVNYGKSVTLTAKAKSGYYFVKWTKNGKTVSTAKTLKLKNIKADASYKAVFKKISVLFTLEKVNATDIEVHWTTVKGADGYQIADNDTGNRKMKTQYTGKNSLNTYTSLRKEDGRTYQYKMRYYKVKDGKKVWSSWTPVQSIKF